MNKPTVTSSKVVPLRTLLVEDNEDDAFLLLEKLKRGGYDVDAIRVFTKAELSSALNDNWDIVFCDYSMPAMNGVEALSIVRESNADMPFIFVSGTIGEDVAVDAMRNGAQDYIMKDNLKRLLPAVEREIKDYETRKLRRAAEQRLYYLTRYDQLTGLPNRFSFIETLKKAIANTEPQKEDIAVVYIDIDRFKSINDSFGYEAGNMLLQQIAKRLERMVADGVAARFATDEFALILKFKTRRCLNERLQAILETLEKPYEMYGLSLFFSASIGISIFPEDSEDAQDLLSYADIAAYRLKAEGGKGFLFYARSMAVQLEERLALEFNMRDGLHNEEFRLLYQPQVDLVSGRIIGAEALLRWHNAKIGKVRPDHFIPLAENTGFILELDDWVLEQACRQINQFQQILSTPLRIAVNVSAKQFHNEGLIDRLRYLLEKYQLNPENLELEITETSIIRDVEGASKTLQTIQQLGLAVALDDFGTGYSSLAYLRSFKTDYLKIDQSFVREIPENKESMDIVSAIIAMAGKLSIKTIAEGVETQAQYDFLRDQGCNIIQGYLISVPVGSDKLSSLIPLYN